MLLQDQLSRPFLDMLHHAASTTPPQTPTSWLTTAKVIEVLEAVFDPASLRSPKKFSGREFFGLPVIESDNLPDGAVVLRAGIVGFPVRTVGKFEIDLDFYADQIKTKAGAQ